MSRARGRRIAPRREHDRAPGDRAGRAPVVVGLVAVVVSAGALAWAGRTPVPDAAPQAGSARVTPIARDFTCAGGLPGARATVGVAGEAGPDGMTVDGTAPRRPSIGMGHDPVRVHAPATVSAKAFAVRSAGAGTWYAAGACPSPRATWWFVGAGASQAHHTELVVANPRAGDAIVDIDVFGPHGVVRSPGLDDVRISSGMVARFDLRKVAPAVGDLAVRVVAARGLVTASAAGSWSAHYVERPVLDWVTGQPPADRRLTLAGLPPRTTRARLLVTNPTEKEAVVRMSLLGPDGAFAPTSHATFRVHPGAVRGVSLAGLLKADPRGVRLVSQVPVTATVRVRRDSDAAYLPAVTALGGSSVLGVPAHAGSATVDLFGGGRPRGARARIVAYDATGKVVLRKPVTARRAAVVAVPLPRGTASVEVRGKHASGALVLGADTRHSFAVLALTPTSSQAKVPAVVPRW